MLLCKSKWFMLCRVTPQAWLVSLNSTFVRFDSSVQAFYFLFNQPQVSGSYTPAAGDSRCQYQIPWQSVKWPLKYCSLDKGVGQAAPLAWQKTLYEIKFKGNWNNRKYMINTHLTALQTSMVINLTSVLFAPDVWQERLSPSLMRMVCFALSFPFLGCIHVYKYTYTVHNDIETTPVKWHEKKRSLEDRWIYQQSTNIPDQHPLALIHICFLTAVWTDSWWCKQCCCRLPCSSVRRDFCGETGKVVVWKHNWWWFIHRQAYCQSLTSRWQRLEEHTWDSCSPVWRCLRPLCRTAWRCSQLEWKVTQSQVYSAFIAYMSMNSVKMCFLMVIYWYLTSMKHHKKAGIYIQRGHLRSLSWTIWKFLTEAWVTRPWKFST